MDFKIPKQLVLLVQRWAGADAAWVWLKEIFPGFDKVHWSLQYPVQLKKSKRVYSQDSQLEPAVGAASERRQNGVDPEPAASSSVAI